MRVTASRRPPHASTRDDIFFRLFGSRPIGASMRRPAMHLAPDEREVFLLDFALGELARSSSCAASCLATTISPDVPLSSRWTMPGRFSPPMPLRSSTWWSSALTSVPLACPAAGWTTMPAGLSTTIRSLVLVDDRQRQRFGLRRRIDRLGDVDRDRPARLAPAGSDFAAAARHQDVAVLDQPLDLRSRVLAAGPRRESDRAGRSSPSVGDGDTGCRLDSDGRTVSYLRGLPRALRLRRDRRARGRRACMIASGASTIEMNCEVENMPTVPRSSPRKNSMMKREMA